ncbi:MAG: MFS transporter [Galbitalea sp.]
MAVPIYGKLSDQFGRRPLYIFGIVVFLIGSLMSSFSTSMLMLADSARSRASAPARSCRCHSPSWATSSRLASARNTRVTSWRYSGSRR